MNKSFSWGKVFTFTGAIIAYLIGSGFASGQEAMQFIAAFGIKGALGAILLTLIIYLWFSSSIMRDGYKLQLDSSMKIFPHYCGKYLGLLFEIYTPIFLFLVLVVMISGAGAVLTQYYGLNPQVGRIIMAVLTLITVLLGLKNLVKIVSKLGPAIIIFGIAVGLANIIMNPTGILHADEVMRTIEVTKAAPTWYISGIIFPSMGCIMITPFLAEIGGTANGEKEAFFGGLFGGIAFALAVAIMAYGIMATIGDLYMQEIPALFIARQMFSGVGIIFSLILFAGIYTTAVPMLWLSSNVLETNEKTKKFKTTAIVLTIVAFVGSQFPFSRLVNVLYPITGYLGIIFMICMLVTQIKSIFKEEKPS
jgi:uncharacterized membrane protein YkvI